MAVLAIASAQAEYSDCRVCHMAVPPGSTTPDFTNYFANPAHHPVSVAYPSRSDYNTTTGIVADILFFDLNLNGTPDPEEVQIFRTANGDAIECSSCHIEHGINPPEPNHTPDYLRVTTASQVSCVTCHNL